MKAYFYQRPMFILIGATWQIFDEPIQFIDQWRAASAKEMDAPLCPIENNPETRIVKMHLFPTHAAPSKPTNAHHLQHMQNF